MGGFSPIRAQIRYATLRGPVSAAFVPGKLCSKDLLDVSLRDFQLPPRLKELLALTDLEHEMRICAVSEETWLSVLHYSMYANPSCRELPSTPG